MTNIIEVENKIITLRDQQVILDSDVAELYGVQTKEINQAVRNNPEKFPIGYIWELSTEETQEGVSKVARPLFLQKSPNIGGLGLCRVKDFCIFAP